MPSSFLPPRPVCQRFLISLSPRSLSFLLPSLVSLLLLGSYPPGCLVAAWCAEYMVSSGVLHLLHYASYFLPLPAHPIPGGCKFLSCSISYIRPSRSLSLLLSRSLTLSLACSHTLSLFLYFFISFSLSPPQLSPAVTQPLPQTSAAHPWPCCYGYQTARGWSWKKKR